MIDHVDRMLARLVATHVDAGVAVTFEAPDKDWRTQRPADRSSLNLYLVDLRENRRLRSTQHVRTITDGQVVDTPVPARVDCHYLASAWSNTKPGPATTPVLDEHALLHRFSSAVANAAPFGPTTVYGSDPLPDGFPPALVGADLPLTLLPADGYPKLAEFWGTMGDAQALKPVVYFTVTVPLVLDPHPRGPVVRTQKLQILPRGEPMSGGRFAIGGAVFDSTKGSPAPMAQVWVDLLDLDGVRLGLQRSDAAGRFVFAGLTAGEYQLRAAAADFAPLVLPVRLPPTTKAGYDLVFS